MILGIPWLLACILVGFVGQNRSIGYWGTFALSLILSPVVGLIIALCSNKLIPAQITYTCKWCKFTSTVNSHFCPGCDKDLSGKVKSDYQNK
jgi:hypothetical protein